MNTEVLQVNTEVFQLKYDGPPHTPDSSGILKYSHPSGAVLMKCCSGYIDPEFIRTGQFHRHCDVSPAASSRFVL